MGDIKVTISADWQRWIDGFDGLPEDVREQAAVTMRAAAEVFFARSQTNVHVITGDLMSTGRIEIDESGGEVTAELLYGGIPGASGRVVDYAMAEENRGGSHAFMSRAWEATSVMFEQALPKAWEAVVRSWN